MNVWREKPPGSIPGKYLAGLIFILWAAGVQAQSPPDVGLVTRLVGEVTYSNPDEGPQVKQARLFMKVRRGDRLKIPAGALTQFIIFASRRQETWEGPVTLVLSEAESRIEDVGEVKRQPIVKLLPPEVSQEIGNPTISLHPFFSRYSGVTRIRSASPECAKPPSSLCTKEEAQERINQARKTSQLLRQQAAADDLTPELYLLNVLAQYQQYPEMEELINSMLARQSGNPTLEGLRDLIRGLSSPSGGAIPK